MNSISKYLLAVVLGLGICGGNADVWGSQEQAAVVKKEEDVLQVDCEKVIRDYIRKVDRKVYGNVLAFKCGVYVQKGADDDYDGDAIIILKNGDFKDPPYVQFTVNAKHKETNIPVYYIPFDKILGSLQHDINCKEALANQITAYAELAKDLKSKLKTDTGNKSWEDRHSDFYKTFSKLEENPYKNLIDNNNADQRPFSTLDWWQMARHTEVQFEVLQKIQSKSPTDGVCIVIDPETTIILYGINNVQALYSMFEPCASCRELNRILDINTCFKYFAIDGNMPEKVDTQYEIYPHRIWSSGVKNGNKLDFSANKIEWNTPWKDTSYADVSDNEFCELSNENAKQICNTGIKIFRNMYGDDREKWKYRKNKSNNQSKPDYGWQILQ